MSVCVNSWSHLLNTLAAPSRATPSQPLSTDARWLKARAWTARTRRKSTWVKPQAGSDVPNTEVMARVLWISTDTNANRSIMKALEFCGFQQSPEPIEA